VAAVVQAALQAETLPPTGTVAGTGSTLQDTQGRSHGSHLAEGGCFAHRLDGNSPSIRIR